MTQRTSKFSFPVAALALGLSLAVLSGCKDKEAAPVAAPAPAKETAAAAPAPAAAPDATTHLRRLLASQGNPKLTVTDSPVAGVKAVAIENGPTLYVSEDGTHAFQGVLLDLRGEQPVNVADAARSAKAKEAIKALKEGEWVTFGSTSPLAHIYVFTDVSCGYCQKLHADMPKLHALGIQVRYLAFPRGGENSAAWGQMQSAWCAEDRAAALEKLFKGESLPAAAATCETPVASQHALGLDLGVTGTPTIVLADGDVLGGYLPAEELAKLAIANKGE
ncbi:DsbC family protein [Geopseudomonas aromaticivorans]